MNYFEKLIEENSENLMEYPADFIEKCLKVYPKSKRIKSLIEKRSFLLGEKLHEEYLKALDKNSMSSSSSTVNSVLIKEDLYNCWFSLYEEQYLKFGNFIKNGVKCYSPQVKLEYDIRKGIIKRGDRVTRTQLRSSVDNLFPTLEQNMERRRIGSDRAGEHRTY